MIQPVSALTPKASFRGSKNSSANPVNRRTEKRLAILNAGGISAVAGALSMAFKCTLMAPHGGIFVVPVMGNALLYLVALVIGTVVSAVLLGVLKKKAA